MKFVGRILAAGFFVSILIAAAAAANRPFLMGTSDFADLFTSRFENPEDKDFFSVHVDDFLGIPWTEFANGTPPPAAWAAKVATIHNNAAASGKILYLALGPLKDRKTLSAQVDASGNKVENWAPVNSSGCYSFSSDANAALYKQAYVNYARYMVDLFQPKFLSIVIEMNNQFFLCPSEKSAFIAWESDVYHSLKSSYPTLPIFPTFQAEKMYGITDATGTALGSWCGGPKTDASLAACFQQRLDEAVTIPGDRIAFSFYPTFWLFPVGFLSPGDNYTAAVPYDDMFTRVQNATRKKIWISETGWPAAQIRDTYQHTTPVATSCGTLLFTTPTVAGDAALSNHLSGLLAAAQAKRFEAVVWWSNRDMLDAAVAAGCPCQGTNDTCTNLDALYTVGGGGAAGSYLEFSFRVFGNMGLRQHDGTPRTPAYSVWKSYYDQSYQPAENADKLRAYPNPFRPAAGDLVINLVDVPAGASLTVFTLTGAKVRELTADFSGRATWDGKNDAGKNVASGVYFILADGGGTQKTVKVAIQR